MFQQCYSSHMAATATQHNAAAVFTTCVYIGVCRPWVVSVGGLEENRGIEKVTRSGRDMTDMEPGERELGQNVKTTHLLDQESPFPARPAHCCREGNDDNLILSFL